MVQAMIFASPLKLTHYPRLWSSAGRDHYLPCDADVFPSLLHGVCRAPGYREQPLRENATQWFAAHADLNAIHCRQPNNKHVAGVGSTLLSLGNSNMSTWGQVQDLDRG